MPRRKAKIIDKDLGWKRIQREIKKARNKPHVQVGIFGAKASADHGGKPNIEIAATHEFGATIDHPGGTAYFIGSDGRPVFVSDETATRALPRTKPHKIEIPERSFLRATFDANSRKIAKTAKKLQDQVLTGQNNTRNALKLLGLFIKGLVQKRISSGIPPPLKAATKKRKGSSKPLIDTGQLRASIDHKVKNV